MFVRETLAFEAQVARQRELLLVNSAMVLPARFKYLKHLGFFRALSQQLFTEVFPEELGSAGCVVLLLFGRVVVKEDGLGPSFKRRIGV